MDGDDTKIVRTAQSVLNQRLAAGAGAVAMLIIGWFLSLGFSTHQTAIENRQRIESNDQTTRELKDALLRIEGKVEARLDRIEDLVRAK